jgi:hypothetical protein
VPTEEEDWRCRASVKERMRMMHFYKKKSVVDVPPHQEECR